MLGRGSRVEEDTVKLTRRLAALSAVMFIAVACGGGGASGAPTQGASGAPPSQGPTAQATPVTIAPPTDLITEGTLTDCVDIEYPPMEFFPPDVTDANEAIGFDVDAAKAVADQFGLEHRDPQYGVRLPDPGSPGRALRHRLVGAVRLGDAAWRSRTPCPTWPPARS